MILVCFFVLIVVAFMIGVPENEKGEDGKQENKDITLSCAYDGTDLTPLYRVDALLDDSSALSFCSITCATEWFKKNEDKVIFFTVVDEITGQMFDSAHGFFVESNLITIPATKNRIHTFSRREDALAHVRQFNGKMIQNPFGSPSILSKISQFDALTVGAPSLPDSIPFQVALFNPIFKENKLNVNIVPFDGEKEGQRELSERRIEAAICDLPSGILLAKSWPGARIIRNVLRANPFRALFAIVAGPGGRIRTLADLEGQSIAVPRGVSFQFYAEFSLRYEEIPLENVTFKEVEDLPRAWDLLIRGEVPAALLRTPYTQMAKKKDLTFLAHDRNLPWMSVLLVSQSTIEYKTKAIKKLLFGLEQSVKTLNLRPDSYRFVLEKKGGIPLDVRPKFPMPIFEGANVPAKFEVEPVIQWLVEKGLLSQDTAYERLVSLQFLPNPDSVGLAFC